MSVAAALRLFDPAIRHPQLPRVEISCAAHDTPIGRLQLAVDRSGAVVACSYDDEPTLMARIAQRISPLVLRQPLALEEVTRALDAYFGGSRREPKITISLALAGVFAGRVLEAVRRVPYGTTITYGELAKGIGAPTSSRAVGRALGSNPVCILVPCHRVVRKDGGLGGYAGGLPAKRSLLALEGAHGRFGPSS
ncbi:MAG TPA: methylated-DNA--[protein]-cysteine S-methyltransferase [Candidatus Dormibacteraeota bacterium]|nr:methylated-DNA--[protein]-cysteine S-methyltransferase [Candidatus Dormibacteraeota bacterium]